MIVIPEACGGLRLAAVGLPHEAEAPLLQKRPAAAGGGGSPAAAGAAVDQKGDKLLFYPFLGAAMILNDRRIRRQRSYCLNVHE